jgi:hypothetical protein
MLFKSFVFQLIKLFPKGDANKTLFKAIDSPKRLQPYKSIFKKGVLYSSNSNPDLLYGPLMHNSCGNIRLDNTTLEKRVK